MTDPIGPIRQAVAGRYDIQREIGQGAFATVYLAKDLRHDRLVAFKILNADPDSDTGELRFLREIRMLASLQHPNILALIDSGHADAMLYYVMPYISGETLRDRIRREREFAVPAAVAIARDASDALDYAHGKGIIHRDIKPENILLSAGHPIIADFGIARAIDLAGVRQLTRTGFGSPGTPAYMSPEQVMGDRAIDLRTDIYSLGAVLYEMLTGRPPFVGKEGFVKRFTEPPPVPSDVRPGLPSDLDAIVAKALARDPTERYASAGELTTALERMSLTPSAAQAQLPVGQMALSKIAPRKVDAIAATVRDAVARPLGNPRFLRRSAVIGLLITGTVAVALAWSDAHRSEPKESPERRWDLVLPDSAPLAFVGSASMGIGRPSLALSRDGARAIYAGRNGPTTALYYRELDKLGVTRLGGTNGAYHPFFSPDGRWVAFYADGYLKKVSVPDDQVLTLTRVKDPMGGDWAEDGRILVADDQGSQPAWVSDGGGVLQPIRFPDKIRRQWRYPRLLPGGEWALHTDWDGSLAISSTTSGRAFGVTSEGVTPRDSTDVSKLLFGTNPVYVASGYILYLSGVGGVLMALPFDGDHREVRGRAAPMLEGIRQEAEAGAGQFAVADDGTFVYAPGADAGMSRLVWLEPPAKLEALAFPEAGYGSFDLAPDGKRILIREQSQTGRGELWILDIEQGSQTRVTTPGIPLYLPLWWPDGKHILISEFNAAGGLSAPVLRQTAESFSRRDTLVDAATQVVPSPDGLSVAVTGWRNTSGIWLLPMAGNPGRPRQLVPGRTSFMSFSPDGRWIVYDGSDPDELFVVSTDHPDERYQISTSGGEEPRWSPRGNQIVYRNRQQWFGVDVALQNGFHASRPRLLFSGPYLNVPGWSHDISPDGRRHLLLLGPHEEGSNRLVVITNWFSELKRRAPAKN